MCKFVLQLFFLFTVSAVCAQQGSPLLTNYIESREIENQSWAICQDENQIMLFATRRGILTLDGQEWNNVRIPTIPYSMQRNTADGKIYIGGDDNFGYITYDASGLYKYISLSGDSAGFGIISKIIFNDSLAWLYCDNSIIRWNLQTREPELHLLPKPGQHFTGMFITDKNTFINMSGTGLHRLDSDTLFPIVTGYQTVGIEILFSLPYNDERVLIGRSDGNLSTFDGLKYYDYPLKDDGYLVQNILSEGIVLGDSAYAFSTLEGGAIVIAKETGKVLYTINNQNELPDDEIFAIGADICGGIWLSHQYGLTRADLCLPVENYSIFPGLKGNLSSTVTHQNKLYVATSEGVYYLTEVKNYADVEVLVEKATSPTSVRVTSSPDLQPVPQATRNNIFSRIFGKKTGQQKNIVTAVPDEGTVERQISKPVVQYSKKKVSRLKSIIYIYKKVDGLNEKCRQLVSTPDGILAASNKGLFIIRDHKASVIVRNRYINYIRWQPYEEQYYVAASDGFFSVKFRNGVWTPEIPDPGFTNPSYTIFRENKNCIWIGGDNLAYRAELSDNQSEIKYSEYSVGNEYPDRYILRLINDSVFLFTGSEIHFYNRDNDRFDPYMHRRHSSIAENNSLIPLSNYPLIRKEDDWISFDNNRVTEEKELSLLKIFNDPVFIGVEKTNLWVIDDENRLFCINRLKSTRIHPSTQILVKSIRNLRGTRFELSDVHFERGDNVIFFDIVAPSFLKQGTTQYQYYIGKIMPDWSEWSERTHFEINIPRQGDYTLQVRAKDLWGNIGEYRTVDFTIKAPFTKTLFFYIMSALACLLIIILIVRFREKQLQQKNRLLEEKVKERTAEIEAQKEEITASIEYASRIQMAMLPMDDHFKEAFNDHFIFFKPRDIVSGDFYWIGEDEKSVFYTVADCTGHGVPGAFMSTMGISTLNEIIANNNNLKANTVLNLLREKTMTALHQTGKEGEAADGMDVAFCVLSKNRKALQFSGAFNPMIIFQGGEFREYRADRMPIGIHYGTEKSFTNHIIPVNSGDTIYIFSDGFTDQFGGPDGVKYKMSNFRNLLKEIYFRPMIEQRNLIENEFERWRGPADQVDDITVIGVRI